MKKTLIAAGVAMLAGCGGADVALQPGQWETTIRFTSIEVPGAPEPMVAQMRQMMGQPQTNSQCITPEQAANPTGNMLSQGEGNCTFTEQTFSGGTIDVAGSCQQPGAGTMNMTMEGTYTATTMEAAITSQITAPPGTEGPQTVRTAGNLTARRTGDCPAT